MYKNLGPVHLKEYKRTSILWSPDMILSQPERIQIPDLETF